MNPKARAPWILAFTAAGLGYLFLAGPAPAGLSGFLGPAYWIGALPGALFYLLAVGILVGAWRLEARRELDGWGKLVGIMVAMLVLIAGKGWRGQVPYQFLVFTLTTILVFTLFALGLSLEFGFAGLINFGHVAFMSIGGYAVTLFAVEGGFWISQPGVWSALILGMIGAAVAGLLLAIPAIRLRADYLAIVTIAAAEILRRVLINEGQWTGGPSGVSVPPGAKGLDMRWLEGLPVVGTHLVGGLETLGQVLGFQGSPYIIILLFLCLAATLLVVWVSERLVHSPWGRCLKAIREDEDAARALGINPTIYKLQVFAIGSAVAALAGGLWAWQTSFVVPSQFQAPVTFWAWIIIVIGGIGDNKGAVAGAFIFWTINALTRSVAPLASLGFDSAQVAAFATLALGALLMGVMIFRPEGLFGDREELELVE